jgi:hypothetical protein
MSSRLSSWRRRGTRAALGLVLAAGLGAAAPAGTAAAAPDPGADPACDPATGSSSARAPLGSGHGEDYNSMTAAETARVQALLDRRADRWRASGRLAAARDGRIVVRTFVHVLTRADGSGGVTARQVRQQMGVINNAYAGRTAANAAATRFHFKLVDVDHTANDAWYDWNLTADLADEDAEAKQAKRALRRGGKAALNVYVAGLGSGLLGYANYPWEGPLALDGLVVLNESLPGGRAAPYNQGDTATHEIGHWLGLAHTFENGCTAPGDGIADTPYQADGDNIFFCGGNPEFGVDTCPQPGNDPVHNFMSYGDDPCMKRFTPQQARRQELVWAMFRARR